METLLFAVILGPIPAMIARSRGRDFTTWWVYGSLLFVVALPRALLLTPDPVHGERTLIAQGMRKCPSCTEMVQGEAAVCRYCGRELTPSKPPEKDEIEVARQEFAKIRHMVQ